MLPRVEHVATAQQIKITSQTTNEIIYLQCQYESKSKK